MSYAEKLQNHMNRYKVSQNQVAKSLGKSKAMINQYLQGKYPGNVEELDEIVAAYLKREAKRLKQPKLAEKILETDTVQTITALLETAYEECQNGVIYGRAGLGKTTALRVFAKQNPEVVLIETLTTYTPNVLLKNIAKKIGVELRGSTNDINEAVIKKLQSSGRLLIVDEAENLSTRSLELLRRLHDLAGIGLVLVGTPRLLSNLKGRHGELEQLYSRVTLHWDLGDSVPREELDAIARATLPELADKAKLRGKIIEKAGGSPRRLFKILSNMYRMSYLNARDDGEILPLDEALLERVEMVLIRS